MSKDQIYLQALLDIEKMLKDWSLTQKDMIQKGLSLINIAKSEASVVKAS